MQLFVEQQIPSGQGTAGIAEAKKSDISDSISCQNNTDIIPKLVSIITFDICYNHKFSIFINL